MTTADQKPSLSAEAKWLAGAVVVGFGVAYLGSDILQLERRWFVLVHVLVSGAFIGAYARWAGWRWTDAFKDWPIGLISGGIAAVLLVGFVLNQPSSNRPGGAALAFDLLWLGLAYGTIDVLLLTILPVDAVRRALSRRPVAAGIGGATIKAGLSLFASLLVTVAYHAGFAEFRGPEMAGPAIGNAIVTIAYLVGMSPIAPFLAHVALHLSAVLHAYATSIPLPPHY